MNELERLRRIGFERVRQVVEDGITRAGVALQPLVEQMAQRLEALWQVLYFLALIIFWVWLHLAMDVLGEILGRAIGASVNAALLFLFEVAVALIAVVNVLAWIVALVLIRRGR